MSESRMRTQVSAGLLKKRERELEKCHLSRHTGSSSAPVPLAWHLQVVLSGTMDLGTPKLMLFSTIHVAAHFRLE